MSFRKKIKVMEYLTHVYMLGENSTTERGFQNKLGIDTQKMKQTKRTIINSSKSKHLPKESNHIIPHG
jgi:hypothetical protein